MDTIQIRGLKTYAIIGVHRYERKLKRPLLVDLELEIDAKAASRADSIKDTIDYQSLSNTIIAFIEQSGFHLVETLAEKLAEKLRESFGISWLKLVIHKPGAIPAAGDVSVSVERGERR